MDKFQIDGVSLGQNRRSVDSKLRHSGPEFSAAWGCYCFVSEAPFLSKNQGTATVISYSPDWATQDTGAWQVSSVSGSTLSLRDSVILRVGDSELAVLNHLGQPDEEFLIESGFHRLRFGKCLVTVDSCSRRVVEFALQEVSTHFSRPSDRPAPQLLDGALAC